MFTEEFLKNYFETHLKPMATEEEVERFLEQPDIQRKFSDKNRSDLAAMWLVANGYEEVEEAAVADASSVATVEIVEEPSGER